MVRRELQWVRYDVSLPAAVAREMRWLTTSDAAAALAAAPTAVVDVALEIPDLRPYPTPKDKAAVLLEVAAEVEHALMVQYLYAAYSLKSPEDAELTEAAQKKVLDESREDAWPPTLRTIAREEMGHLMTVQNLRILLALPLHFEREDDQPDDDNLHPFPLKLQPLTQQSLAKYVVAESPGDAEGIGDIVEIAITKAGWINRVGILYALLALVFARKDQIDPGATGDASWDGIVRGFSLAAYSQDTDRDNWHLPDIAFHPETLDRQADPDDWNSDGLRVDRVATRAGALEAIRFIGVQGEGPSSGDQRSHFERFLGVFRGDDEHLAFPGPGMWTPTRSVPTNPKAEDFSLQRTRHWAELGNERYALLLGFFYHYLLASGDLRQTLTAWIFAEMRGRVGFIARELTSRPARADPSSPERAGMPFKLPDPVSLPDGEPARWRIHRQRTVRAIAIATALRTTGDLDPLDGYLNRLVVSDQARLEVMKDMEQHPQQGLPTSFTRDIEPLFVSRDFQHLGGSPRQPAADGRPGTPSLASIKAQAAEMVATASESGATARRTRSDPHWSTNQIALLQRWLDEGSPP
jgi:hypothetical protein